MSDGKNVIRIFGPKSDGSYWLELRQADGQSFVSAGERKRRAAPVSAIDALRDYRS